MVKDVSLSIVASVDPALEGRELGPWMMIPAVVSVPVALILAAILVWYFVRLGRGDVPAALRRVRRIGIGFALASILPLIRALTFVHPHEDRAGWAAAWAVASLALLAWFSLAVIDVVLVVRGGAREYRELRREVFGRPRGNGADDGTV